MSRTLHPKARQGALLQGEREALPRPAFQPDRYGVAIVGDTRQGELCRARVWVGDGRVAKIDLTFLDGADHTAGAKVLADYLLGRPVEEVLDTVTGRSCAHDGCSSVEGKCFSLAQEAIFRALAHAGIAADAWEGPALIQTAAGAVDLAHQSIPPHDLLETPSTRDLEAWAQSLVGTEGPIS